MRTVGIAYVHGVHAEKACDERKRRKDDGYDREDEYHLAVIFLLDVHALLRLLRESLGGGDEIFECLPVSSDFAPSGVGNLLLNFGNSDTGFRCGRRFIYVAKVLVLLDLTFLPRKNIFYYGGLFDQTIDVLQ